MFENHGYEFWEPETEPFSNSETASDGYVCQQNEIPAQHRFQPFFLAKFGKLVFSFRQNG
jgi:hypothetical protein